MSSGELSRTEIERAGEREREGMRERENVRERERERERTKLLNRNWLFQQTCRISAKGKHFLTAFDFHVGSRALERNRVWLTLILLSRYHPPNIGQHVIIHQYIVTFFPLYTIMSPMLFLRDCNLNVWHNESS